MSSRSFPGNLAIGHTRYSTTGDSAVLNAQPIMVDCNKGMIALAHNGNLVNANEIRARLEAQGSIFQTTSDTEVIVHLIAQSKEHTLPEAVCDALRRIEGAFSLVMMTRDRVFAIRDPRGFRPLSMGRIPNGGPTGDTVVFASETCAFDLIGAVYERDVKPGEMVVVGPEGTFSRYFASEMKQSACIFEHVYFSRPDSVVFGRSVQASREAMGRQLAKESPVEADLVVPVPDSGVAAALGYSSESLLPFRFGLIRNHYVGRTFIEPEQRVRDFRRKAQAESHPQFAHRQADNPGGRFHCPRDYQPQDCPHGARCRRKRSARAHLVPANGFSVLLRRGHAVEGPAYCFEQVAGRNPRLHWRGFAGVSIAGRTACSVRRRREDDLLHVVLHGRLSDGLHSAGQDTASGGREAVAGDITGLLASLHA